MQEEEQLVRRAQAGDQDAFACIYQAYFERVYRYTRVRLGSSADAEDLTEQVFLNMIQSLSGFKWRGVPFSAWVFRIARNAIIDHLRRCAKNKNVSLDEEICSTRTDPQDTLQQILTREELVVAINKLTQAQREVIALRFVAELSTMETAQAMGKSLVAVKALQHSALAALRRNMSPENRHG